MSTGSRSGLHKRSGSLLLASLALSGCPETYCQMGPKHGTQCHATNAIEWQETQVVSEAPRGSSSEPAPGCVTLGSNGLVQQPYPIAGAQPPAPRRRGSYVMSGACVTQRQPAHGAVR